MGIEAFVFGILSVYLSNTSGPLGIICGIIGLMRSKKALTSDSEDKFARAGKICSIIGIISSALSVLFLVAFFALYFGIIGLTVAAGVMGSM